jgi:hypothetical protein
VTGEENPDSDRRDRRSELQLEVQRDRRFRGVIYAISVLVALLGTILITFITFLKTGKSFTELSGFEESTTAALAMVATAYASLSIFVIAAGSNNAFRQFAHQIVRVLGVLVGVDDFGSRRPVPSQAPGEATQTAKDGVDDSAASTALGHVSRKVGEVMTQKYAAQVNEIIRQEIEGIDKEKAISLLFSTDANSEFDNIIDRLNSLSATVLVRSFFNLVVGIGFAIFSIGFLAKIIDTIIVSQSYTYIAFGIRVGISLTSVLVSYFFLRLYQKGLEDVKYIHDEITSIQLKKIAFCDDFVEKVPFRHADRIALLSSDRHSRFRQPGSDVRDSEKIAAMIADLVEMMAKRK